MLSLLVLFFGIMCLRPGRLLRREVFWKLEDGKTIRSWEDSWLPFGPLCDLPDFSPFMDDCKDSFGVFVVDNRRDSSWVNLPKAFPPLLPIQLSLLSSFPCLNSKDSLIWKGTSSGHFSVAYVVSLTYPTPSPPPPYWEKAWVKNLIPKVNIFFLDYASE